MYVIKCEAGGSGGGGEVAGGEGELQVVAAGGAGEVEDFAGEEEVGEDFGFEGVRVDFRRV